MDEKDKNFEGEDLYKDKTKPDDALRIENIVKIFDDGKKAVDDVKKSLKNQLEILKTSDIAKKALENSYIIFVDNLEQAVEIANKKAPEHLEIMTKENEKLKSRLTCYGSLFVGDYSAEVLGDYCSGTNHILPTNKVARYNGGLSVFDFIKILRKY